MHPTSIPFAPSKCKHKAAPSSAIASFEDDGRLLVSDDLPPAVGASLGLKLKAGRRCGSFNQRQSFYLDHHRSRIFGKKCKSDADPVRDLFAEVSILR